MVNMLDVFEVNTGNDICLYHRIPWRREKVLVEW